MANINCAAPFLALAAVGLLTACGGGGGGTAYSALYSDDATAQIQALITGAGPPEEITEEESQRRAAQDRTRGWLAWTVSDTADDRHDVLRDLAFDHWDNTEWHGVFAKDGITVDGNQAGGDRALRIDSEYSEAFAFTTDNRGGGIAVGAGGIPAGSAPVASATWQGLMVGADRDSLGLLEGDAEITFDFAAMTVDASFSNIVNLDTVTPHAVASVSFSDIQVNADDGRWTQGSSTAGSTTPNFIGGGFGGPGHEEAAGAFWTPDMLGAYSAKQ